jgi:hypothetical protein
VHLQRKQHVLEKETLLLRRKRDRQLQEKEKVLKVKKENVRTYSLFLNKDKEFDYEKPYNY